MIKHYRLIAIMAIVFGISPMVISQNVAINLSGSPSASTTAILDLSDASNNKLGLLLPNVSITAFNGIAPFTTTPTTGMIVWNTNAAMAGGFGVGFYYYTGTQWNYLDNSGASPTLANHTPGTGLSGAVYNGGTAQTWSIANTTVTAGNYGTATSVPTYTVNAQGQLTGAANVAITGLSVLNGGATGAVLSNSGANVAAWSAAPATTGNILLSNNAGVPTWMPIGATTGQYMRNTAAGAPVWSTVSLPNADATGDIWYANGANTMTALAAGTNGYVLTLAGGVPTWAAAAAGGLTTANNGLSVTGSTAQLGGNLIQATTITNNANTLTVAGSSVSTVHAATGAVGIGGAPSAQVILDLTNSMNGGAPLRWSTNANPSTNITSPQIGDMVYNSTTGCFNFYNGAWVAMGCPCSTGPSIPTITASCSQSWQGSSITYTSSITNGVTFTWSVSSTLGTPTITSGQGTSSITVTWPSSGAATGTVTLVISNMCGSNTGTLSVPINTTPTISGTTPINISTTGNAYTCSQAGATYAWSSSNTWGVITSATNIQTITVTAGSTTGSFTLSCNVSFGSCSQTITYAVTVNACTVTHSNITLSYTGGMQTWTVPCGITIIPPKIRTGS